MESISYSNFLNVDDWESLGICEDCEFISSRGSALGTATWKVEALNNSSDLMLDFYGSIGSPYTDGALRIVDLTEGVEILNNRFYGSKYDIDWGWTPGARHWIEDYRDTGYAIQCLFLENHI